MTSLYGVFETQSQYDSWIDNVNSILKYPDEERGTLTYSSAISHPSNSKKIAFLDSACPAIPSVTKTYQECVALGFLI